MNLEVVRAQLTLAGWKRRTMLMTDTETNKESIKVVEHWVQNSQKIFFHDSPQTGPYINYYFNIRNGNVEMIHTNERIEELLTS